MSALLPGFEYRRVDVDGVAVNCASSGSGPPVLMLHGYPQNHLMWRDVAPALAEDHTVVLADLRGYGDSGKPEPDAAGEAYAKRSMAQDQVGLMRRLGFEQFQLVGHDRGARVSHRLALDHPDAVTRLAVLDIVPTRHMFHNVTRAMATAYYHWFFLPVGNGIPERLPRLAHADVGGGINRALPASCRHRRPWPSSPCDRHGGSAAMYGYPWAAEVPAADPIASLRESVRSGRIGQAGGLVSVEVAGRWHQGLIQTLGRAG